MACYLRIIGEELDPDDLVKKTGLSVNRISRKGEPRMATRPDGPKLTHSSAQMTASSAEFENFNQQVTETIDFLQTNYEKLARLNEVTGIEFAVLSFGVAGKSDMAVQNFFLGPEVIQLAGQLNLSIEMSVYLDSFFYE